MTSLIIRNSILKFDTGCFRENKIREAIDNFIQNILNSDKFTNDQKKIIKESSFEINVVGDRNGTIYGYSFVWISSKELYHLLAGNNIDSTPYIIKVVNAEYKPLYDIDISKLDEIDFTQGEYNKKYLEWCNSDSKKWSNDIECFKEELREINEENKYLEIKERLLPYPEVDGEQIKVSEGYVLDQDTNEYNLTKLRSEIKDWITEDMLISSFQKFNTDPNIYTDDKNNKFKYPKISIFNNRDFKTNRNLRIAIVQFSKDSNYKSDASFAKLMRQQTKFTHPETGEIVSCFFSFWKNNLDS